MPEFQHKATEGDCTCFASLTIDGRRVKLKNHTKMRGTAGTGTGIVEFYAFNSSGTELHKHVLKLSVGSNAWTGIARKEHEEEYDLPAAVPKSAIFYLRASASETSGFDGPQAVAGVLVVGALAAIIATGGAVYVLPAAGGIAISGSVDF